MSPLSQRFLVVYSGVLTLALATVVLGGFALHSRDHVIRDEITVQRLNIVEPDGTLRMVISDQARLPGAYVKGKEYSHDERKAAGALFYDNEGTETGGLIYGSVLGKDGRFAEARVHLGFDQDEQDQVFAVDAGREGDKKFSTLRINEVGDYSILEAIHANERIGRLPEDQREAEWGKFAKGHPGDHTRVLLGRTDDQAAVLKLKDRSGHDRILLQVGADGTPVIQLLDVNGKVSKELR